MKIRGKMIKCHAKAQARRLDHDGEEMRDVQIN